MNYRLFTFCFMLALSQHATALNLLQWFENPNQRAIRLMQEKQFEAASKTFTRPDWQAVATYRAGQYEQSAKQFANLYDVESLYNQGNALAHQRKYAAAIQVYEKALKLEPNHEDAKFNRDLLKKMQEQQQNNDESDESDESKEKSENDKQDNQAQNPQNQQQSEPSNASDSPSKEQEEQNDQSDKQKNQSEKPESKSQPEKQPASSQDMPTDAQKDQALRLIPDDPGGLLREKFWRDHWRRLQKEAT